MNNEEPLVTTTTVLILLGFGGVSIFKHKNGTCKTNLSQWMFVIFIPSGKHTLTIQFVTTRTYITQTLNWLIVCSFPFNQINCSVLISTHRDAMKWFIELKSPVNFPKLNQGT